jgi:hypothetical protein
MLKRHQQDEGADGDAAGARRDRGGDRHHRGLVAVVGEVMLGEPDRIEARGLDRLGLREHLGVEIGEGNF